MIHAQRPFVVRISSFSQQVDRNHGSLLYNNTVTPCPPRLTPLSWYGWVFDSLTKNDHSRFLQSGWVSADNWLFHCRCCYRTFLSRIICVVLLLEGRLPFLFISKHMHQLWIHCYTFNCSDNQQFCLSANVTTFYFSKTTLYFADILPGVHFTCVRR